MARTYSQFVLHCLSGDDMDVLLQLPTPHHSAVQLLDVAMCGHNDPVARHPLCATIGQLSAPPGVLHAVGAAALYAHLLLCPQGLEKLLKEQPVDYLHHRYYHSHTLPNRHHVV